MGASEQSMESLVNKKEQQAVISKLSYELHSSNVPNKPFFIETKHHKRSLNTNHGAPRTLSSDIQREAAEYLLSLNLQSRNIGYADKHICSTMLHNVTTRNVTLDVAELESLKDEGMLLKHT